MCIGITKSLSLQERTVDIFRGNSGDEMKCIHYKYIDINMFSFPGNIWRKFCYGMNFAGAKVLMVRHLTPNLALGNTYRLTFMESSELV